MDIVLQTNTATPSLVLRDIERGGEPDRVYYSATVAVRSEGGFTAERPFYFDDEDLTEFLSALRAVDTAVSGVARLGERYGGMDYIQLEVRRTGRVAVTGELVQYTEAGTQRLQFAFQTDQTCLRPLIRDLEACRPAVRRTSIEPAS